MPRGSTVDNALICPSRADRTHCLEPKWLRTVGMLLMMMMMITLRAEPGEGHTYGAHRYKRRVALTRTGARVRVERAVNVPEAALHRAALTTPQAERARVRCAR